jgi:hypothetical protein
MADRLSYCIFGGIREAIVRKGSSENYNTDRKEIEDRYDIEFEQIDFAIYG